MNGMAQVRILLVEPHFVLRRTIISVSQQFGMGQFQEATSIDVAMSLLSAKPFDGIILDLGDGPSAAALLLRLRKGAFASDAGIPVIALTSNPKAADDDRLKPFGVHRTICKPFKVAHLLDAMQQMAPAPAPA